VKPEFATEQLLCGAFMEWAAKQGWTPYAETAGWDILLVGRDGTQIGVQAKLRWNMSVLLQTIPTDYGAWHEEGPDFRAILLPRQWTDAAVICGALGIRVMYPTWEGRDFVPAIADKKVYRHSGEGWHYWCPLKRHKLPEYVPDVPAGASGPVQLTEWKVAALKICAVLEIRGHVTRADFKRYGIDHRRWTGPGGWLDIDRQHPKVYAEVLADVRKETLL
jgi:hypothetical protein